MDKEELIDRIIEYDEIEIEFQSLDGKPMSINKIYPENGKIIIELD